MEFNYALKLALDKHHLKEGSSTGLNADSDVVVFYEVPLLAGQGAKDWLKASRKTVKDVKIDHQELKGIWRSVSIESQQSTSNKDGVRLEQTFRKGWITTLVNDGATDWTEARVVDGSNVKEESAHGSYPASDSAENPQEYHLVQWEGVDPKQAHSVSDALTALPAIGLSPVINGEELGDDFIRLKTTHSISIQEGQPDKSATITMLFGKPRFSIQTTEKGGTDLASDNYFLFDVPSHMAQALIDSYEADGSYDRIGVSAPNERGLVNITFTGSNELETSSSNISGTSCRYISTSTYYYGQEAPLDAPENTMGITYESRFRMDFNSGKYSGTITKRQRETQHIAEYESAKQHDEVTTTEEWIGLYIIAGSYYNTTLTIVAGAVNVSQALVSLPTGDVLAGDARFLNKGVNEDCTENVTLRIRDTEELVDVVEYDSHDDQARHDHVVESINIDKDTGVTLTAGANEILSASVRYNKELGTVDIKELTSTSKNRDGRNVTVRADRTTVTDTDSATPTAPSDPVQADGTIITTRYEEAPHLGRYQASTETITAVNQTEALIVSGHSNVTTTTLNTQGEELPTQTATAGHIIRAADTPTDFGKHRTVVEDILAVDQTSTDESKTHATTTSIDEHTQGDAVVADALADGITSSVSNAPTEAGKFNTKKTTRTAIDQPIELVTLGHSTNTTLNKHTQFDGLTASQLLAEAGKIKRASDSETEFGKHTTALEVVEAVDQTTSEATNTNARTTVVAEHTQNTAEATADAAGAGTISSVTNAPTEFGRYNTRKTSVTAVDQTSTDESKTHAVTTSVAEHTQGSTVTADTLAVGVVSTASNTPTEFGLFGTKKTTRTAIDQATSEESNTHARTVEVTEHTQASSEAVADAAGVLTTSSVTNAPTEYGRFATRKVDTTAVDQTSTDESKTHAVTTSVAEHTQGDAVTASALVAGVVSTASNTPTEYGKFDTKKTTRTAIDQETAEASNTHATTTIVEEHTQASIEAVADAASAGVISSVTNAPNEFGRYSTRKTDVTAVDQTSTDEQKTHARTVSTAEHTQGDAVTADALAAGIISTASNTPTMFGKNNTRKSTITAIDQTSTDETKTHAVTVSTAEHTQGSAVTADALSAGIISVASNTPTEFGKNNTRKETRTAIDQTGSVEIVTSGRTTTTDTHTQGSAIIAPVASVLTKKTVVNRPTDFGKNNTVETLETVVDLEGSTTSDKLNQGTVISTHTQGDALAVAPVDSVGINTVHRSIPTEYGKFQTSAIVTTAKAQDTEWTPYESANGTNYYRVFSNLASNADLFEFQSGEVTEDYNISFRATLNEFGLYNGGGTATIMSGGGGVDWFFPVKDWTEEITKLRTGEDGVTLQRVEKWDYAQRVNRTYATTQTDRTTLGTAGYECGNISNVGKDLYGVTGRKFNSIVTDWA